MKATRQLGSLGGGGRRKHSDCLESRCQNGTIHSHFGEPRHLRFQPDLLLAKKRALRVLREEPSCRFFARSSLPTTLRRQTLCLRRGLFLWRCRRRFLLGGFSAGPAEQGQSVLGVEREAANGLFAGGAQGNVHAPVVGQAHGQEIPPESLLVGGSQVWIRFDQFLDVLGTHVFLEAKGADLEVVRRHALLYQVTAGALHAARGKFLVVFLGTANVSVAPEDQVRVGFVGQILFEVDGQGIERRGLARSQTAVRLRQRGLCGREVNTVQGKALLETNHFRRRGGLLRAAIRCT